MDNLGISSAFSAYKVNQVSFIRDKQESSCAENPPVKSSYPDEINDEAIISDKAKALSEMDESERSEESKGSEKTEKDNIRSNDELTLAQEQEIAELKARDLEVKAHEQAHIAAATGINVSAPSYDYQIGPDGKKYAAGGEVNISFVEGGDPASDIAKAKIMKAAALAPAQPSSQDLSVARNAERIIAESKKELAEQQKETVEMIRRSSSLGNQEGLRIF